MPGGEMVSQQPLELLFGVRIPARQLKPYFVYVLQTLDTNQLYIGFSSNLKQRIKNHKIKKGAGFLKPILNLN